MSEQAPTPENTPEKERKPLMDNCDRCDKDYELTPENTVLNHYSMQDDCDHLECNCTHCGYVTLMFIGEQTFEQAVNNGINVVVEKNAPQAVYDGWKKLYEVPNVPTYELTARHEALVTKFGEVLATIPDEVFWDNIEADTERPYPLRWIEG